ncbi:hypothetical protein H9P43_003327 [Blastocladiella emersonii ATCC 22665]|nr:hypothetical protein H9P43_003327 [Blastocladiella emersonii ATCC 22665]
MIVRPDNGALQQQSIAFDGGFAPAAQFSTASAATASAASPLGAAFPGLVIVALAVVIPMVLAASVAGCLFGRSGGKSPAGSLMAKRSSKDRGLPTTSQPMASPAFSLQVAIPTSSLMDDKLIDAAASGNTNHRYSSPPGGSTSSPAVVPPPPAVITRNAAVQDTPVNPALLVQLLHSTLHKQQQQQQMQGQTPTPPDTPTRALTSSGSIAASMAGAGDDAASALSKPSTAFLRERQGSVAAVAATGANLILPDKTVLVRGNFDVPGIPTALPPTTTMGATYGARHLVADWDHLYQTVLKACTRATPLGGPGEEMAAWRLTGRVAHELLGMMRALTSRAAGESIWVPLIYTHHDEYVNLPRATLLQPAEMYLAVHELMYDRPKADAVQAALADPLAKCSRRLHDLFAAVNAPEELASSIAASLPWATVALLIRAKRYRPSLAFVEVSGTGSRPEARWMDVLNVGAFRTSGRVLARSPMSPTTPGSLAEAASLAGASDVEEYDPLTTVAAFVWPGVLDLAESQVRIRARVVVSV